MAFSKLALPPRFEAVRRIGEGGMGVVYEALDLERDERVALKTIVHHDADTVARVKHEFRALQDIHHPNLVQLRELVADTDDVFFTMELVDGVDLLTWIRGPSRRAGSSSSPTVVDRPSASATDTEVDLQVGRLPTALRSLPSVGSLAVAEGAPDEPPSHVQARAPDAGGYDEGRLRDAFRQIALGLSALHAAGKVHRDVKPSNVRVTPSGRVVLLDFGLVFEVDARAMTEGNVVGTPAYMAPEQVSATPVGPEADWYATGVMLFECLTGRRPFEGSAAAVLLAKYSVKPLPPSALVVDVPQDLEELCVELMRVEPRARPSGQDVLRRLQARSSDRPASSGVSFVGRDAEMRALERAFGDVVAGRMVTIALHGESGVGKSCLVRRFFDVVLSERQDVLVLSGRCYERESVPYKALDEVVELLSRRLARLTREEALDLLPPDSDSLALLFPALGRIPALVTRASIADRDPLERRRAAFRALRELLRRLGRGQRVVITIDDLQWTDADSLALLHEVLRPPDAPPILLVVTMRSPPGGQASSPSVAASLPGEVRSVHVDRLSSDDAQRLAEVLLAQVGTVPWSDATTIAAEAGGHPLFIDELVRHATIAREKTEEPLRLDDALWRRVLRLDGAARRALDVTCVLGAPVSQEVVAQAAGIDMGELARAVSLLRASNLVRTHGARVTDAVEPFHDRVREAVVARLSAEARRDCHGRIAVALELSKGSDPEVLSTHWAGANEPAKAARHALVAAEQAAQALAFARAARLFRRALELLPGADLERRAVRERLGDALAKAGDASGAAAEYELAAQGAGAQEALDLRRRATEQLLRAGRIDEGFANARVVLAAVGIGLPRTTLGALLALVWFRLILRLRGTRFAPRAVEDVPRDVLTRIDVCWSVSFTLPYADALTAAVFHARHVFLAVRRGDTLRAARALSTEAAYVSTTGGVAAWPRVQRVLAVAHAAADQSDDAYTRGILLGNEGIACVTSLRFGEAVDILERAVETFRQQVPGSTWEINTALFFLFMALAYTGRYGELLPRLEAALADAVERGDLYAAVMLRVGVVNSAWLAIGDPGRARRELEAARSAWSQGRFHAVHFQALVAEGYVDLYDGDPQSAYDKLHRALPALRRSLILHLEGYRLELAAMHVRIALACAAGAQGAERARLVREAERAARDYTAPGPLTRVNVGVLRANVAALDGRDGDARAALDELARDDGADESWLARQCALWLAGRLDGDEAAVAGAEGSLRSRGIVPDPRLVLLWFPAFAGHGVTAPPARP